jgi:pimeloyl-ACP methyl ester carboxylesterase
MFVRFRYVLVTLLVGIFVILTAACDRVSENSSDGASPRKSAERGPVQHPGQSTSAFETSETNDPIPGGVKTNDRSKGRGLVVSGKTAGSTPGRSHHLADNVTSGNDPSHIEKISGYRVPGEYITLPSKRILNAITVVTLPIDYFLNTQKEYPLIIAFGGAGECAKPPRTGALAWMHYYKMDEAVHALAREQLDTLDFRGLVKPEELQSYNRMLREQPYRGVIVACPYSPLLSMGRALEDPDYEAYLIEELVPALLTRYRVAKGKIGVDGVSMGGARSMYYGLKYPQVFSTIGSVQGAFGPYFDMYEALLKTNAELLGKRQIQLLTSDGDSMRMPVQKMHELLQRYQVPHTYLRMTGPHDYVFNQGPGSIGLLVFHDRALNRDAKDPNIR